MTRKFHSHYATGSVTERMDQLFRTVLAGILLVLTAPLLIAVTLAIKCESPGPALVRRSVLDRNGRRAEVLNFRVHEWDTGREKGAGHMTRLGQFLWYTRIQTLPQLINMARGEVNLIDLEE